MRCFDCVKAHVTCKMSKQRVDLTLRHCMAVDTLYIDYNIHILYVVCM